MSGPAPGKIPLRGAKVFACNTARHQLKLAAVYIHLKGWALARVTHLDIEHGVLERLIRSRRGLFLSVHGTDRGIEIVLDRPKQLKIDSSTLMLERIEVVHRLLRAVLAPGKRTRTWVGGKAGGIYIGWRKVEIAALEALATKVK